MGRHFKRIEEFTLDLELLTNKAVKDSLKAGLDVLVNKTTHDSSNAAAHWVVVPDGERPRSPWFLLGTYGLMAVLRFDVYCDTDYSKKQKMELLELLVIHEVNLSLK